MLCLYPMKNIRTPIIAANWKMHKTRAEASSFVEKILHAGSLPEDKQIIIAVSPTLLETMKEKTEGTNIVVAAQNMFYEEQGAFTAEVSPLQLKDIHVFTVLIGHSERRHIFGETDELIQKKIHTAVNHGIIPLFCLGETLEEREAGNAEHVVRKQLSEGLQGLNEKERKKVIVAYEPVWAIGTGKTATPEQAEEMHAVLRNELPEETRILYGGSVKPENAQELIDQPSIDGFLVGGASLEPETFKEIIEVSV